MTDNQQQSSNLHPFENSSGQGIGKPSQQPFDWTRFWIRFVFGVIPGTLFGFGFWIQMCRPAPTLGLMEHVPRLVTHWLGAEERVDSGLFGIMVVLVFACIAGILVAAWPSISKQFKAR